MLLTQEIIKTHNGVTTYQIENNEPISAVFVHEDGIKTVAKDKDQATEWWDTDKWFRKPKRR